MCGHFGDVDTSIVIFQYINYRYSTPTECFGQRSEKPGLIGVEYL